MSILNKDRLFPTEPTKAKLASKLFQLVENIPIISPHGHTDARWFSENNSFEGWMRRIVVNTAISLYRKDKKHANQADISEVLATPRDLEASKECDFTREELENAISRMPEGYGMVFKLYVIDGYKHKEIAEMLDIEVNTSKSQLSRAKKFLQGVLLHMEQ